MTADKLQLTDDETQEIANVLAAHPLFMEDNDGNVYCGCAKFGPGFPNRQAHRAHVTAALAPVVADMIAAHRVEALVMDDLASDETVLLGPVE